MARAVVVVGGSAGAMEGLVQLVRALPADLDAPVLVVLHFPATAISRLGHLLAKAGQLPTTTVMGTRRLRPGHIYVCPPDHHLVVHDGHAAVNRSPRENNNRPAIDPLFRSAAHAYGPGAVGVLLCGLLDDGSQGMAILRRAGGTCIVQDPITCDFPDMPANAIAAAAPQYTVTVEEMPAIITATIHRVHGLQELVPASEEVNGGVAATAWGDEHPGKPSGYSCPDCGGVLWQVDEAGRIGFECRIGHRYSLESFREAQADSLESALWAGIRALEEQASLADRLAEHARERGDPITADSFEQRSAAASEHAEAIRAMVLPPSSPETESVTVG